MKRLAVLLVLLTGCSAPSMQRPARHADCNAAAVLAAYAADLATLRAANASPAFAHVRARLDTEARGLNRQIDAAASELAAMRHMPQARTAGSTGAILQDFSRALDGRFARAHAYLDQQAREKESSIALDFDRAHLKERLQLELRLRDGIYLQHHTAQALRARLAVLDAARRNAVDRQRALDERWIAGEDARLRSRFAAELRALARDIPPAQRMPATLPDRSRTTSQAFRRAADDLSARYTELGRIDEQARTEIGVEIAALAKERQALRERCPQQGSSAVARK